MINCPDKLTIPFLVVLFLMSFGLSFYFRRFFFFFPPHPQKPLLALSSKYSGSSVPARRFTCLNYHVFRRGSIPCIIFPSLLRELRAPFFFLTGIYALRRGSVRGFLFPGPPGPLPSYQCSPALFPSWSVFLEISSFFFPFSLTQGGFPLTDTRTTPKFDFFFPLATILPLQSTFLIPRASSSLSGRQKI